MLVKVPNWRTGKGTIEAIRKVWGDETPPELWYYLGEQRDNDRERAAVNAVLRTFAKPGRDIDVKIFSSSRVAIAGHRVLRVKGDSLPLSLFLTVGDKTYPLCQVGDINDHTRCIWFVGEREDELAYLLMLLCHHSPAELNKFMNCLYPKLSRLSQGHVIRKMATQAVGYLTEQSLVNNMFFQNILWWAGEFVSNHLMFQTRHVAAFWGCKLD
ncbi:MAG: hypothetical protein HQ530_05810 [Parcubacteria group bacterium]|nr:hypothetical protein [Parcubacteria group bacterium]